MTPNYSRPDADVVKFLSHCQPSLKAVPERIGRSLVEIVSVAGIRREDAVPR